MDGDRVPELLRPKSDADGLREREPPRDYSRVAPGGPAGGAGGGGGGTAEPRDRRTAPSNGVSRRTNGSHSSSGSERDRERQKRGVGELEHSGSVVHGSGLGEH